MGAGRVGRSLTRPLYRTVRHKSVTAQQKTDGDRVVDRHVKKSDRYSVRDNKPVVGLTEAKKACILARSVVPCCLAYLVQRVQRVRRVL